jgi:hypothetical protein
VDNPSEPKPDTLAPRPCAIAQDGSRIPHHLALLLVAMTGWQLCRVMRLAGPLGIGVQDITAQALPVIVAATWPVAYLRHLVRSGRDWRTTPRQEVVATVSVKGSSTRAREQAQPISVRAAQAERSKA